MSERKKGWFWIKQKGLDHWECAQWNGYAWHGIWIESVSDCAFDEIGPRIPSPDESWQCVPLEATPDMIEHGMIDSGYCAGTGSAEKAWRYFLAAAPKPEDEV